MAGQRNNYAKRLNYLPERSTYEGGKRTNPTEDRENNVIGPDDTAYRYLCPVRRIGSIMGIGGEIAKQLRAETHAKIRISEVIPGCDERVVTIHSSSEKTNSLGDDGELVSPAHDALFKVHDRVTSEESQLDDNSEEPLQVFARLLVLSDQIGCVIGKGGQVVQSIRSETGAQVRILGTDHLPPCALPSDELLQISGELYAVKKALFRVASHIHDNPSRSQHLLSSASIYRSGGVFSQIAGAFRGRYRGYSVPTRNRSASVREFSIRLVCPSEGIGAVIGKGGAIIKQIRQESGASIKIDTSDAEGDDCIISVWAKETFEDASPAIDATMRLQPRCSLKIEKDSGDVTFTTRLLAQSSRVGCLLGKGGAVIAEMRNRTKATIRILSEENLPKVASADDEMVQITGELSVASSALLQVLMRLRANVFEIEGTLAAVPSALPYVLQCPENGPSTSNRDMRTRDRGYSSSSGHDSRNSLQYDDGYGGVRTGGRNNYGLHGAFSDDQPSNWGLST